MTNRSVVTMVKAGLPEDIVIAAIRKAEDRAFDLSATGLVALSTEGVSSNVIRVMLDPASPVAAPVEPSPPSTAVAPPAPVESLPSEIGVYVLAAGKLLELQAEVVNWKTGGLLKTMATAGIKGPHVNGWVGNPASRFELPRGGDLLIMTPEGTTPTEYQLLRLDIKKDRREFRAMTTGMLGAKGGASNNAVPFEQEKRAARTYVIRPGELKPGEYGILPPGMSAASVAAAGRLYGFTVK